MRRAAGDGLARRLLPERRQLRQPPQPDALVAEGAHAHDFHRARAGAAAGPSIGSRPVRGLPRRARAAAARDSHRRRRAGGAGRGRARPAARLWRALSHPARGQRRGRPGPAAPGARARRAGRAADRRSAHAGHGGHRVPHAGAQAGARGQAGAADRLRRHRGRDRGDQRGGAGLLPAQAVGSAGGGPVPGARGPAHDLGGRGGAGLRRRARDRPPVLEGVARPARLPVAQPPMPARWLDVRARRRGGCACWT